MAIASSVTAMPSACAASRARVSSPRRNICGVSARQSDSRDSVASVRRSVSARLSVSRTGAASKAPPAGMPRATSIATSSGEMHGRAASWTRTKSPAATSFGRARKPDKTEPLRSKAPIAVRTGLPRTLAISPQFAAPSASTTIRPAISAHAASRSRVRSSIGLPSIRKYCLGTPAPKRRPLPAAGTMHQRRSVAAIVRGLGRVGRFDDLIERLARLQEAELRTRAFFDGFVTVLEIVDFGGQGLVARLQFGVLGFLIADAVLQTPHFAHAALTSPQFDLQRDQEDQKNQGGVAQQRVRPQRAKFGRFGNASLPA